MKQSYVNVSCANLYRNPTYHTEIDSQVTLWEKVDVLALEVDFAKIRTEDGYEGWVSRYQLADHDPVPTEHLKPVTVSTVKLFEQADRDSRIAGEAVAGGRLWISETHDTFIKVSLPDGREAWTETAAVHEMPALSKKNLVAFSQRYLGIPYFWGGKTPKGLDCSGFIQLVFKLFGTLLRRDAWMQHEDARMVSTDPLDAGPADLLFFAESGERITHVAIAMGDGLFIHARGMVRINSLNEFHDNYDESLKQSFVDVKSYL